MVKVAHNVSSLGYLKGIRIAGVKPSLPANGSARAVLEAAEETLRAREDAGYERGRRETQEEHARQLEELRKQWRQEWEAAHRTEVIRALESLTASVYQQLSEVFRSLEKHTVMLAGEAAVKLTSGIPIGADVVEACIRETMNLVEQDTEITVVLNPQDLALLEQHQSSLLNRAGAHPVLKFRADEKITRGGCVLETKFGELDSRRETKIELLRKAVNE